MSKSRTPTEREMLELLREGKVELRPFAVDRLSERAAIAGQEVDGVLELAWNRERFRFAIKCKALGTPKAVEAGCDTAVRSGKAVDAAPLLFLPYLSRSAFGRLQERNVSGIDLCGNLLITVPGKIYVERTGNPNRFSQGGEIKNVYRKASSIVARTFLLVPEFESLGEALAAIDQRGGGVTLATVSKVCKQMAEDLVIERSKAGSQNRSLRLLQADKLLGLLEANYSPPAVTRSISLRLSRSFGEFAEQLKRWNSGSANRIVQTGDSSAERYAVLAREPKVTAYCTSIDRVMKVFGSDAKTDDRFANCTLLETDESQVYFDGRGDFASSPIQTYLELSRGDKRSKETGEQVKASILAALKMRESKDVPIRSAQRKSG